MSRSKKHTSKRLRGGLLVYLRDLGGLKYKEMARLIFPQKIFTIKIILRAVE